MTRIAILPDGIDPTQIERDTPKPNLLGCVVALVASMLFCGGFGAASALTRTPPPLPTRLGMPTDTATPTPSQTLTPTITRTPTATATPSRTPTPAPITGTPALVVTYPTATGTPCAWLYRVRAGQTLDQIARLWNISRAALLILNPWIKNPSVIPAGASIKIPYCAPTATAQG